MPVSSSIQKREYVILLSPRYAAARGLKDKLSVRKPKMPTVGSVLGGHVALSTVNHPAPNRKFAQIPSRSFAIMLLPSASLRAAMWVHPVGSASHRQVAPGRSRRMVSVRQSAAVGQH
jgi:hypothetical protein